MLANKYGFRLGDAVLVAVSSALGRRGFWRASVVEVTSDGRDLLFQWSDPDVPGGWHPTIFQDHHASVYPATPAVADLLRMLFVAADKRDADLKRSREREQAFYDAFEAIGRGTKPPPAKES